MLRKKSIWLLVVINMLGLADRRTIWEIALLNWWKDIKLYASGFLSFRSKENNFLGEHPFLFINAQIKKLGTKRFLLETGHLWQFPVEFEPMWSKLVIRICHYNKELYDCQLQIMSEASPHKHVKWRWVGYKSSL